MAEGCLPGLDRTRHLGPGPAGMAGRNRRDRRHSGYGAVTFSIVARCAESGMFGVAVASSSPAVAARCAYARAGVGASRARTSRIPPSDHERSILWGLELTPRARSP